MSDEICRKCKKRPANKSSDIYVGKKIKNSDGTFRCTNVSKREVHTCTLCRAKERLAVVIGSVVIVLIAAAIVMFTGGSPQSLREGSKNGFPLVALLGPVIAFLWERWYFWELCT